jgi:phage gp36-like protein
VEREDVEQLRMELTAMDDWPGGAPIPASLTADEVEAVAHAALQDAALRVVVALSGIHALPARQIRAMLLEKVDLAGRRLDPEGLNRPLDDCTTEAIADYITHRHRRRPSSTHPHFLVSRNTATMRTSVGTFG